MPLRWYDVNLVDEDVAEKIRRGTWQDMIPTQGPGTTVIGEVARANYPRESYEFQQVMRKDLDEAWQMGPAQAGSDGAGTPSATESQIIQTNFSNGIDKQRTWIANFIVECAEAIGSMMQMFQEIPKFVAISGPSGEVMTKWDRNTIPGPFVYSVKLDTMQRPDMGQKKAEALNQYKMLRRDNLIDPKYVISEVLMAHDLDTSKAFAKAQPPPPPEPQVKTSLDGADIVNPIALAMMQKTANISPEDIKAALEMMKLAGVPVAPQDLIPTPPATHGVPPGTGSDVAQAAQMLEEGQGGEQIGVQGGEHLGLPPSVTPIGQRYEKNPDAQVDSRA